MIATPPDTLDEFLSLPVAEKSSDPRIIVRRGRPEDFEAVYDCVDAAFGKKRPRKAFDWIYRDNPYGRARIWLCEEAATGRIVKAGGFYPWPIWKGERPLMGSLAGDAATVPDWQRQGLTAIRRVVRRSHP